MITLYVSNLPYKTTKEELQSHFEQIGPVIRAAIGWDHENKRSRGFGFVDMDERDAASAIENLNATELDGRIIYVKASEPKPDRRRGVGSND